MQPAGFSSHWYDLSWHERNCCLSIGFWVVLLAKWKSRDILSAASYLENVELFVGFETLWRSPSRWSLRLEIFFIFFFGKWDCGWWQKPGNPWVNYPPSNRRGSSTLASWWQLCGRRSSGIVQRRRRVHACTVLIITGYLICGSISGWGVGNSLEEYGCVCGLWFFSVMILLHYQGLVFIAILTWKGRWRIYVSVGFSCINTPIGT